MFVGRGVAVITSSLYILYIMTYIPNAIIMIYFSRRSSRTTLQRPLILTVISIRLRFWRRE